MRRIGLDLNDCLMDNQGQIQKEIYALFGIQIPAQKCWDDTTAARLIGVPQGDFLRWAYQNPSLQMRARPNSFAAPAIRHFELLGYTIDIVTSTCLLISQVVAWLDKWGIPFDNVFIMSDKANYPYVLIDDNINTLASREAAGLPSYRYIRPHNIKSDCPGVTWLTAVKIVEAWYNA